MTETELATLLAQLQSVTGADFSCRSFGSRLRTQKVVYFLKQARHPWTRDYYFSEYFHGPYSPVLAADYYKLLGKSLPGETTARVGLSTKMERLIEQAVARGNNFLEAAATLHLYLARNPSAKGNDAILHLKWLKPQLSGLASEALAFLREHQMIPGVT